MVAGDRAVAIVKTRRSSPGRQMAVYCQGGVQHHDVACQRGTSALGWPSSSQTLRRLTQMLAILSTRTISVTERFGTIISRVTCRVGPAGNVPGSRQRPAARKAGCRHVAAGTSTCRAVVPATIDLLK